MKADSLFNTDRYRMAHPDTNSRRRTFAAAQEMAQYEHDVLEIARVVRVVKGGRRFRFRASVVVGDKAGTVGFGSGKSRDIQQAIEKAQLQAEKNVVTVPLNDGTVPHEIMVKHKGAQVLLRPARSGTGVIAGGTVRKVAELAGIRDLVSKRYGSPNKVSNAMATIKGLSKMVASPKKNSQKNAARDAKQAKGNDAA